MKKDYSNITINWQAKTSKAPQQRLIYEVLLEKGEPLTPKEISSELDAVSYDYIRTAVGLMVNKGLLVTDEGYYWINTGISQDPDESPRIPQTRDVQGDVKANPPVTISKSTYGSETEKPVYTQVSQATLEDKILSLVDLDAMKQLMDTGAGDVQEGFFSVFRRMHDGEVYKFTVRVDVELERGQDKRMAKPQTDKGSPREE